MLAFVVETWVYATRDLTEQIFLMYHLKFHPAHVECWPVPLPVYGGDLNTQCSLKHPI
jgi:hypothetical protein